MRKTLLAVMFLGAGAAAGAAALSGFEQSPQVVTDDEWCRESSGNRDRETACEVREFTLGQPRTLRILDNPNGSVSVSGSDRSDIRLRARVMGQARTAEEARRLVSEVRISISDGRIETNGPRRSGRSSWWVSYRAEVPRASNLELETSNGSVNVTGVSGDLDLSSSNGSLRLTEVAGDVRARTSNGSLHVTLSGSSWSGAGLDARTSNGSVRIDIPEDYNARLVASTSNGSLRSDIPLTVQGRIGRDIDTTLGSGGPTIRVGSSNGSVQIRRR